jgi:plasmid stabilization system protein ParE
MKIVWFGKAWEDLDRLHAFIAEHDLDAADAILDLLAKTPETLLHFPRRGSRLSQYAPRDVREFRIVNYVLRYEVEGSHIFVLRFFHAKEDRA